MGAYPTIARWGIVTGSEKIGKREKVEGQAPPYKMIGRREGRGIYG
jgi:hypothetical protein